MKRVWGYHLMIDLASCSSRAVRCPQNIARFSQKIVKEIGMVAFGPPLIVRFGEDDKMGYTLVQLIETSNISAHFCEETNEAYIDIFSCKPFDKLHAKKIAKDFFSPKAMITRHQTRGPPNLK